MTYEVWL